MGSGSGRGMGRARGGDRSTEKGQWQWQGHGQGRGQWQGQGRGQMGTVVLRENQAQHARGVRGSPHVDGSFRARRGCLASPSNIRPSRSSVSRWSRLAASATPGSVGSHTIVVGFQRDSPHIVMGCAGIDRDTFVCVDADLCWFDLLDTLQTHAVPREKRPLGEVCSFAFDSTATK